MLFVFKTFEVDRSIVSNIAINESTYILFALFKLFGFERFLIGRDRNISGSLCNCLISNGLYISIVFTEPSSTVFPSVFIFGGNFACTAADNIYTFFGITVDIGKFNCSIIGNITNSVIERSKVTGCIGLDFSFHCFNDFVFFVGGNRRSYFSNCIRTAVNRTDTVTGNILVAVFPFCSYLGIATNITGDIGIDQINASGGFLGIIGTCTAFDGEYFFIVFIGFVNFNVFFYTGIRIKAGINTAVANHNIFERYILIVENAFNSNSGIELNSTNRCSTATIGSVFCTVRRGCFVYRILAIHSAVEIAESNAHYYIIAILDTGSSDILEISDIAKSSGITQIIGFLCVIFDNNRTGSLLFGGKRRSLGNQSIAKSFIMLEFVFK